MVIIDQEILKSKILYNAESGKFFRIKTNGSLSNELVNIAVYNKSKKVYNRFMVCGKLYLAHRLAFLYMNGSFPRFQVDHINGNGLDNRWINLREVTHNENAKNRKLNINNTSGICGVTWDKSKNKWMVQISVDNKRKTLGYYESISEARNKRQQANEIYGFHENHGLC